ncbi:MAG: thioredoxin family protein [Candidatus Sumerlaeia bacterium]|nr:thioredoxin family protein [Candidatus Sumerlaeia bacterium]
MKRTFQSIAVGFFAMALVVGACAGAPPEQLEIGKPAPSFKLPNVDGKTVDSAELLKTNKALVVVFMANHCPVAVAYQDRLIEIQKDYKERGVAVVAISSNDAEAYPADSFENMKKRAEEKKYNFPFLYDESQEVARNFRATCTPHVFVIDAKGNLAYRGAVDDNQDPKKVKNTYLRDALDAVLAGKPASPATTKQVGCTIKWKKEK